MGLFTKSSTKKKSKTADSQNNLKEYIQSTSPRPLSPSRKSPSKSVRDRDTRAGSSSPRPTKASSKSFRSSSRQVPTDYPADTHPLNLPPEERERRVPTLSAMTDSRESMDVDQEEPVSPSPISPPPVSPGPFGDINGVDHMEDVRNGDGSPVPPPHRIPVPNEPQPPPKPSIDAEACKAAGNKFFKQRDYDKAIREYSKGLGPNIWLRCDYY